MYQENKISIITATYNRADKLHRVFDSLQNQTYRQFEWILIDDGSTDNTRELVESWKEKADYIRYFYQENQGKHVAVNRGLDYITGEYMTIIDSDDEVKAEAFEILINEWHKIPPKERSRFKSVTAKCYDPASKEIIGEPIKGGVLDCSSLDARYKYNMNYERWGLTRTEVAIQYRSKEIEGRFYPETILQDECARKYLERYIDIPLRGYYKDAGNAITKTGINKENYYLWVHNINDNMDYFRYAPKEFIKSFIGISMTGFCRKMKVREMIAPVNNMGRKIVTLLFVPCGYILYKIKDR